jgi:ubiquinone/menaquinone biosynthesis C-methylase UbiE
MSDPPHHQRADTWSGAASDYERLFFPFSDLVAAEALARIGLRPGEHLLDVAAGTGAVSLRAARARAEVTAVDFAVEMLEMLRRKARAEALGGIRTLVMDGQALEFEADGFDVAGSNLGLVFFRDPARGLRELRRVVRPGGRVFVTSVSTSAPSRLMELAWLAILATATGPIEPSSGPTYGLGDVPSMEGALSNAGLVEVAAEDIAVAYPVRNLGEFWDKWILRSPPTYRAMLALDPAHAAAARARFLVEAGAGGPGAPASFEAHAIVGVARV